MCVCYIVLATSSSSYVLGTSFATMAKWNKRLLSDIVTLFKEKARGIHPTLTHTFKTFFTKDTYIGIIEFFLVMFGSSAFKKTHFHKAGRITF
jgi:hypothetical protein